MISRSTIVASTLAFLFAVSAASAQDPAKPEKWSRERLVKLLRELADEAHERFLIKDKNRRIYGMSYEFVRDGKHVQTFGLDSMHDGAWLMSALITAHRIDPKGGYLKEAQKYEVPFYVNVLLNSDRLFPRMIPREGQEKFDAPIKGWAPRGWDDGPGIDLVTGKPHSSGIISHPNGTVVERDKNGKFVHSYFTSSHHLLQDLADSLLNVWLTTRDPDVAKAILLIHEGRMKHGLRVPVVQAAAGLANNVTKLYKRAHEPKFEPARALRPLWQALVEGKMTRVGYYNDGLAWDYRAEAARAALAKNPIARGFVVNAIGNVYAHTLTTEAFFTDKHYRPGYTLFAGGVTFDDKGRLKSHFDGKQIMFSRGMQFAWVAAATLPSFKKSPQAWQAAMDQLKKSGDLKRLANGASALGVSFESDPKKVAKILDDYVVGTIDYWAGVRKKLGYLPRGYYPDGRKATWVRTAELGAYAHLMHLIAFRLMQIDGVTETELIRKQLPAQPIRHEPLPASVLELQGLKSSAK